MSAKEWQNGGGSLEHQSTKYPGHGKCTKPCQVSGKEEAKAKANIIKTYEYKISMSYDDLANRTQHHGDAKGMSAGAASSSSPGSSTPAELVAPTEFATPTKDQENGTTQVPIVTNKLAASRAVADLDLCEAVQHCGTEPFCQSHSVASATAGERGHILPGSGTKAVDIGCRRCCGANECAATVGSNCTAAARHGCGGTSIKNYVHFFEMKRDAPDSPKKFVPPIVSTTAMPAVANGCNFLAPFSKSQEDEALLSRKLALRSNPTPNDTQQSLIRLSCAASGYGKYISTVTGYSVSQLSSTTTCCEAQQSSATTCCEAQQSSATTCCEAQHEVGVDTAAERLQRQLSERGGHNAATSNGSSSSSHETKEAGSKRVTAESSAESSESSGKEFLAKAVLEEEKLKELSQLCQDDVDKGVLTDEVCGVLRSAIGKATLLVTKKFKQFKELCNKNMTQSADERYKTTSEDLQGFWDMMMLQVEDVYRSFTEIARLRSNGWQYHAADIVEDEISTQMPETPARVSGISVSASTTRSKTTPGRRPAITADGSRMRKESASACGTPSGATPSSKAREEARQRLLAAKKAMRKSSTSNDDGSPLVDVVFLGNSSLS